MVPVRSFFVLELSQTQMASNPSPSSLDLPSRVYLLKSWVSATVEAVPKLLKQQNLKLDEIDHIELNEAFAAQNLAVIKELDLDPAKVNPLGGAIALGHPLGCTGAKLAATLIPTASDGKVRAEQLSPCAWAVAWGLLDSSRLVNNGVQFGSARNGP